MAGFATEHPPEKTTPLAELPMYHWQGTTESSAFESPTIPLQDIANFYFNVSSMGRPASYHIPAVNIAFAVNACKSRRNLAGLLATKIFTLCKKATSNWRSKLGDGTEQLKSQGNLKYLHEIPPLTTAGDHGNGRHRIEERH